MSTQSFRKKSHPSQQGFLSLHVSDRKEVHPVGEFFTLGRATENSLIVEDAFVSSRHCRIEKKPDAFVIKDMRSQNSTFLNGVSVIEAKLSDGDRITLGQTELIFTEHRDTKSFSLEQRSKNSDWDFQLQKLPTVAQSNFSVLINGPSGSGKEIVASLLHRYSKRAQGPFISVNCSALSESLVESELFGHVAGSFTGATGSRKGAFEAAKGGTLFLDEIGDLPLHLQPKLLRALENQEIKPVGSDKSVPTDVRILAASHKDLKAGVLKGTFREDLFFRLNIVRISPPPLKNRMEDFENLLYHFAKEYKVSFSESAILELKKHSWPGNIRELKNVVARGSALYGSQGITPECLPYLLDVFPTSPSLVQEYGDEQKPDISIIKSIEKRLIEERLTANSGNQRKTALELNMPKSTLHDRIKTYQINVDEIKKGF